MSTPSTKQTPTNKKIAKAAKAGGSRARSRTNISWSYWGSILGICALGMALIVGSVIGKSIAESAPFSAPTSKKLASANKDLQKLVKAKKPDTKKVAAATVKRDAIVADTHWHSAYGVYKCDAYLGKIVGGKYVAEIDGTDDTLYPDVVGIHAHDDGLIHIHPFVRRSAGRKALLGSFLDTVKAKISSQEISYPGAGGKTISFNVDKTTCGKDKKKPVVSVFVWRDIKKPSRVERYTADFKRIPLLKDGAYAFAITAPGSKTPPVPPSEKSLEAPVDVPVTTTIPAAGASTSTTVKATEGTATTKAPAGGATTAAPASTAVAATPATTAAPATTKAPVAETSAAPTTTKA